MLLPKAISALTLGLAAQNVAAKDWESPAYKWLFSTPLAIPPVKTPTM